MGGAGRTSGWRNAALRRTHLPAHAMLPRQPRRHAERPKPGTRLGLYLDFGGRGPGGGRTGQANFWSLLEARGGLEPPNRGFADLSLSLLGTAPCRDNRVTLLARQPEPNHFLAKTPRSPRISTLYCSDAGSARMCPDRFPGILACSGGIEGFLACLAHQSAGGGPLVPAVKGAHTWF